MVAMRINLVTPFAEKDAVKALGARWDSVKKIWYIVDAPDLTPFMRWIPDLAAAADATLTQHPPGAPVAKHSPGIVTKPAIDVPHCGCQALPWDDCKHTAI
jgi:hypothetical protein